MLIIQKWETNSSELILINNRYIFIIYVSKING